LHLLAGHYVAYRRHPAAGGGRWYLCNDSSVSEVYEETVANESDAHLLVYERLEAAASEEMESAV
jgi:ubiquitin C-terminal hydrolase